MENPYYSANQYFRNRFGTKLIKLALDGGFSCPNRDGTLSDKGCIFCSEQGSGDFSGDRLLSITEQIAQMKEKMSIKWKNGKYLAYFQAYTNTYAPVDVLRKKYLEAIADKDVLAISIATRPDCINPEVLELLKEINQIKPVFVELGFQSSKPETVKLINRLYENEIFRKAVFDLKEIGINVIAHVIIGLPNEDSTDLLNTLSYAVESGIDGIKLQLLHILKNTPLEKYHYKKPFHILTMEEYIDLIILAIKNLPPEIVIHRITGDGNRQTLIEPKWSLDKKRVLNSINRELREQKVFQGSDLKKE